MSNDAVVKQYKVFFSKELGETLQVHQFPLRTHSFSPFECTRLQSRYKPGVKYLELDIPLDTASSNYSKEKGSSFASGITEDSVIHHATKIQKNPSALLTRQTLSSSLVPANTSYFVAAVKGDAIHLTRISATLQLRPSLKYIDDIDAKNKHQTRKIAEEEKGKEEKQKLVQLQFKKKETEEEIELKKKSFAYLQKLIDEEAFVPFQYCPSASEESQTAFARLFSSKTESTVKFKPGFLDLVCPIAPSKEEQIDVDGGSSTSLSMHHLSTLNLENQVKTLMLNARIMHFRRVYELISCQKSNDQVISELETCAHLINGCWIVKSELFLSGRLAECRNHLLHLFKSKQYISRKEFSDSTKLAADQVKDLFGEISRLRAGKGWELRLEPDLEFMKLYPEVVRRQNELQEQILCSDIQDDKKGKPKAQINLKEKEKKKIK